MHYERFSISDATAELIRGARESGHRVIAVGTTTLRVLESAGEGGIAAGSGRTNLFVRPPFHFKVVDALITNFHLPCSSLLMLAAAFAAPGQTSGRGLILRAYEEAIAQRYRFFSYGDAMLLR
jgi:S-adenosylmethionine:tRNA ribosyltransferase-isomerase